MKSETRGVCRHCEGSLIWVKPFTKAGEESPWEAFVDEPRWFHMHPDQKAANAERNIIVDQKHGPLGIGCPTKEGVIPGRVGQPREYCAELKGDWPRVMCNKPVVDPDIMMCGVHIKKHQERIEAEEKSRTDRDFREAMNDGLREVVEKIQRLWNLKITGEYLSGWNYRAAGTIDPFELYELLVSITGPQGIVTEEQEVA